MATHMRHAEHLEDNTGSLFFFANFTKASFAPVIAADKGVRHASVRNLSATWLLFEWNKMW